VGEATRNKTPVAVFAVFAAAAVIAAADNADALHGRLHLCRRSLLLLGRLWKACG
jgi:hypothetical protein